MPIQTIITDLDRTLLRKDKSLSAYTLEILRKCREQGWKLLIATARPYRDILSYLDAAGAAGAAAVNGGVIVMGDHRLCHPIPPADALQVLSGPLAHPEWHISLEAGYTVYSNREIREWQSILTKDLIAAARENAIYKILVSYSNPEQMQAIQKSLPEGLYSSLANGHLIQIQPRTATKWQGVQTLLQWISVPPEQALYFGDDFDDLECLKNCGWGVAVKNAIPEALAAADDTALSNEEDGVARYLEEHLLGREINK